MEKYCNAPVTILLVLAVCVVVGCQGEPAEDVRVACVGDSITYGAGITNRSHYSYPSQLGRMLGDGWDVRNFGHSGATLLKNGRKPYWAQKAYGDALEFNPDVVVILLGTNDVQQRNWVHKENFTKDYGEMIDAFSALPSKPRIWIAYPTPAYSKEWAYLDDRIRDELKPLVKEVGQSKGVPVIDLHTPLRGKPGLFPDDIHPNTEGARIIAEEVYQAIK